MHVEYIYLVVNSFFILFILAFRRPAWTLQSCLGNEQEKTHYYVELVVDPRIPHPSRLPIRTRSFQSLCPVNDQVDG